MPSSPKFRDIRCQVRLPEVKEQFNSKQAANTSSNICIAGKITVDLKGKQPKPDIEGHSSEHHMWRFETDANRSDKSIRNDNLFEVSHKY